MARRASILGGMLDVIVQAKRLLPKMTFDWRPRWADAFELASAAAEVMGYGATRYRDAVRENLAARAARQASSHWQEPALEAILSLMSAQQGKIDPADLPDVVDLDIAELIAPVIDELLLAVTTAATDSAKDAAEADDAENVLVSRSRNAMDLRGERFPLVGPFEGMRPLLVVAPNIGHDLGDEGLPRSPNASLENVFCDDIEPYFDLVHP